VGEMRLECKGPEWVFLKREAVLDCKVEKPRKPAKEGQCTSFKRDLGGSTDNTLKLFGD